MTDSHPPETIALFGNPNTGKTTIFNALTGQNEQVGNYAGVTVGVREGRTRTPHGKPLRVLDLPGTYSLSAASADESVAIDHLTAQAGEAPPDLVLCVLDASMLERQLPLALQVIALGMPTIVVLNMIDVAEKSGIRLDIGLLSEELGVPVVPVQANKSHGILELKQAMRFPFPAPAPRARLDAPREEAQRICSIAARRPEQEQLTLSDKIDHVVLHPVWGWLVFAAIMFTVFWSIFSLAAAPMGWIESTFATWSEILEHHMAEGDFRSLLNDGVLAGVGGVMVFLPQIVLLFVFIGLLESSGYMARAAFLMDGVMSRAGLSGRSFLPLFSSYACAIPGVMATRTIPSAKERMVTIFVAPWMSCSARLPVYFLIIPLLLHQQEDSSWKQALVLFAIYALGTLSALAVARMLRPRLGSDDSPHHFMLELPAYRTPQWPYIIRHTLGRAWSFVAQAGTVILALSILLWALSTYPKSPGADSQQALEHSCIGRLGTFMEPVVRPLGFDGRTGTAILTSFAAREVFNSSMAILYRTDVDDSKHGRDLLRQRLAREKKPDGSPLFTPLTLISLLVFYIYALQCLPTSAVVARESRSTKWAVAQFVFMSGFAYLAALLVYQIGKLLGHS